MESRLLIVLALAMALFAGPAAGQQLKGIPRPPAEDTPGVEPGGAAPGAKGAAPSATPGGPGSGNPMGRPGSSTTLGPATGSDGREGVREVPAGGLTAKKKKGTGFRLDCAQVTCIDRVRVDPEGTRTNFEVITTQPARAFIEIGLMRPQDHKFSRVERAIFTVPYRNSSKTHVTGLAPNLTYYYVVRAKGQDGLEQWAEGSFSTTGRKVDVVIENIHVSNDGDDVGPGDFIFLFDSMGSQYALRTSIHSNSNKSVGKTISVSGVPPSLRITMNVREDDSVDGPGGVELRPGTGKDYVGNFDVETTGEETRNFSISAADGEFALVVTGKLHVSYE